MPIFGFHENNYRENRCDAHETFTEFGLGDDTKDIGGAVAQLEERLHGMQEVVGSIPIGSTIFSW